MDHLLKQPDNPDNTNGDHLTTNLQNIEMRPQMHAIQAPVSVIQPPQSTLLVPPQNLPIEAQVISGLFLDDKHSFRRIIYNLDEVKKPDSISDTDDEIDAEIDNENDADTGDQFHSVGVDRSILTGGGADGDIDDVANVFASATAATSALTTGASNPTGAHTDTFVSADSSLVHLGSSNGIQNVATSSVQYSSSSPLGSSIGASILNYTANDTGQYYIPDFSLNQTSTGSGKSSSSNKREIRLLKNREAAKECRRKKKEYVKCVETRVKILESQNKKLIEELKSLKQLYQAKEAYIQQHLQQCNQHEM